MYCQTCLQPSPVGEKMTFIRVYKKSDCQSNKCNLSMSEMSAGRCMVRVSDKATAINEFDSFDHDCLFGAHGINFRTFALGETRIVS